MTMTMKQIADERAKLDREEAALKREEVRINNLTPHQRIAEELHSLLCRQNHTDGCGWGYETVPSYPGGTWAGWEHKEWLNKAIAITKVVDADLALGVLQAIPGYRGLRP